MAEPIAVVGLGLRFPSVRSVAELWRLLAERRTAFRDVPPGRWPVPAHAVLSSRIGEADKVYVSRGAFLDDADLAGGSATPSRDPLFRLAQLVGGEAWRDGVTAGLEPHRVGVALGNLFLPTAAASAGGRRGEPAASLGQDRWAAHGPAQALADSLGLTGGAIAVDAACASSLYALGLAMRRLRAGQADAMLAGGVSRPDCFYTQMGFCQLRALSAGGVPRPFDRRADGMLTGEGGAVFLLKRLADALRDGDHIHVVLHAVGLSNDRQGSLLAPSREGQLRALRAAYAEAGWEPSQVDLIECHATGTPVGDRTELESLLELNAATRRSPAVLGSVKANLGHTLTAAGGLGLLKVLGALKRQELPPQPDFGGWLWEDAKLASRFRILNEPEPWPNPDGRPRRAAVSGFGFGGVNAHLLVEEWRPTFPAAVSFASPSSVGPQPFALEGAAWRAAPPPAADLAGLGIPPIELGELIAEQRALLALANDLRKRLGPSFSFATSAVVIGMELPEEPLSYSRRWTLPEAERDAAGPKLTADRTLGSLGSIVASRVARLLGCGGPSFVISAGPEPLRRLLETAEAISAVGDVEHVLIGWIPFGTQANPLAAAWRLAFPQSGPLPDQFAAFLAAVKPHRASVPKPRSAEVLSYAQCLEFAGGSAAKALGPTFAPLDAVPIRVRLPEEPLMLVDRVTELEAEPLSMKAGRIVTEHDVRPGDWHLDGGRMPTSLSVESGQADLLLVGYLGIDLVTQGEAVYRLLDATITLHRGLPRPGETVRYDIRIERFQRYGETHLFFFSYDATIAGQPFLTMRHGCAGFFRAETLRTGEGLVLSGLPNRKAIAPAPWLEPAVSLAAGPLGVDQVAALRLGDLAAAFGPAFAGVRLGNHLPLPGGRLALVHSVEAFDPHGGRHGRGLIRSTLPIQPDDWHLVCHFKGDPVMPGTLMYECCLQTLRVWLLRAGFFCDDADVAAEPVVGVASALKCRGQVIPTTKTAQFEVHLKETGFNPNVYAIADAILYADGKPIVFVENMSLQFTGVTAARVDGFWAGRRPAVAKVAEGHDRRRILEFALGKPSVAFGPAYRPFDAARVVARLPAPPYQFLDRIEEIQAEPLKLKEGGRVVAAYDVPPESWYFAAAGGDTMPFAVLLEAALQPCGWLAAYLGSALTSTKDLSFRNLGGTATQHRPVGRDAGTLRTEVVATKIAQSLDMIIQHFRFAVRQGANLVYDGTTYFGFFTKEALAQQEGVRGVPRWSWPSGGPGPATPLAALVPGVNSIWSMLAEVRDIQIEGGPARRGEIVGSIRVDPANWFFAAHFHQDSVWPGSLGLEAFLQALRAFATICWPETRLWPYAVPEAGTKHEWVYRGQVLPTKKEVVVRAAVRERDDAAHRLTADGVLYVDGLPIYEMKGFRLKLAPQP